MDTGFSTDIWGHVLREVVWGILYLKRRHGAGARKGVSKMGVKDALRQVGVEWERSPTFGYVFRNMVVVDRRLQFRWRNSPGILYFFCVRAINRTLTRYHFV